MKEKKNWKRKILDFIKNLGLVILFGLIGFGFLWLKSAGESKGIALETKRKICAISQNDSVAKGFELENTISLAIINKLDSAEFDSYQMASIEMFDNEYNVHRLNDDYFCAVYNNQDTIMLDKINETRVFVMNRLFVETRTDELNDYLGGWFF